jgi:phosphatidylglycerophosphate synthase
MAYKEGIGPSLFALGPVPATVPPADYVYRCEDHSLLKPLYDFLFVRRFVARLSPRTAPNDVSLLSQICAFAPVAVTIVGSAAAPWWLWGIVAPLGYLGYIVFDNADGAHARRTSTSSPLGELVDHWCDAWNAALLPVAWALAWGARPAVACALGALTGLAYVLAMDEHRATGALKLDAVGGAEAMTAMMLSMVAIGIFGRDACLAAPLVAGLHVGDGLLLVCAVGTSGTILVCLRRRGASALAGGAPFVVGAAMVLAWIALGLHPLIGGFILAGLSAVSAGRSVLARTTGLTPRIDAIGFLAIVVGLGATSLAPLRGTRDWIGVAVAVVVAARACADFRWGLCALGRWLRREEVLGRFSRVARVTK